MQGILFEATVRIPICKLVVSFYVMLTVQLKAVASARGTMIKSADRFDVHTLDNLRVSVRCSCALTYSHIVSVVHNYTSITPLL